VIGAHDAVQDFAVLVLPSYVLPIRHRAACFSKTDAQQAGILSNGVKVGTVFPCPASASLLRWTEVCRQI